MRCRSCRHWHPNRGVPPHDAWLRAWGECSIIKREIRTYRSGYPFFVRMDFGCNQHQPKEGT